MGSDYTNKNIVQFICRHNGNIVCTMVVLIINVNIIVYIVVVFSKYI